MNRIISKYYGRQRGPMLICIGAMHGNEPAGVQAIRLMAKMLEVEPITNPDFVYRGMMLGVIGNLKAYKTGQRFIDRDLNRTWTLDNVQHVRETNNRYLSNEKREVKELLLLIEEEIAYYKPKEVIVLDLHTTSSFGGIFSIATDDPESLRIAVELQAPVVTGMLKGIHGTSLHYFNTENLGVPTTTIVFESGQHEEPLSVNRAIAAITNCMRTIGSVDAEVVENQHDHLLRTYSKNLPKVTRLIMGHCLTPQDGFKMQPGFNNFERVKKGDLIATNTAGEIRAIADGLILMPLYQEKGEDGFFIVEEIDY